MVKGGIMWFRFSSLPVDFREFEQQLYTDEASTNFMVWFDISDASINLISINLTKLTLSNLLQKYDYTLTYCFIYDVEQKRLMQLPNDKGKRYLDFFKDFYEVFTRYWRLDDKKRKMFDDFLYTYTYETLSSIIEYCVTHRCSVYDEWRCSRRNIRLAKTLLTCGCIDKVLETYQEIGKQR